MKIASNAVAPPFLADSPHANFVFPICPTFLSDPDETGEFGQAPRFGDGTAYPLARTWMTNAAHYCRPGRLILRKESFYTAHYRGSHINPPRTQTFNFGPVSGPLRTSSSGQAIYQYQLSCQMSAVVGQTIQDPPPPAGLVNYRISLGYGFTPEIGVDAELQGQGYPMYSNATGKATYLNQIGAVGAYFIEDVFTRGLTSIIYNDGNHRPPSHFEECGRVEYDFTDQFKVNEDKELTGSFPLYRDAWSEDGLDQDPPNPKAWKSIDALISVCYVAWDKPPDAITQVTSDMTKELQGLIRM